MPEQEPKNERVGDIECNSALEGLESTIVRAKKKQTEMNDFADRLKLAKAITRAKEIIEDQIGKE